MNERNLIPGTRPITPPFRFASTSTTEEAATTWHYALNASKELKALEINGLIRGYKKGKRPNVPLAVLKDSLEKQIGDFERAWQTFLTGRQGTFITGLSNPQVTLVLKPQVSEVKRTIADLRNVAAILFERLQEEAKWGDEHEG